MKAGKVSLCTWSLSKRTWTQLAMGESRLRVRQREEMTCAKAPSGREGAEQTRRSSGEAMVLTVDD